jgi:hypothetical protein
MPGHIIYRGPSMLDGSPIVAVAIHGSTNAKTGDMLQTYILSDVESPTDAARTGRDTAVCGDCKHRPANAGTCYVVLFRGPLMVWKTLQRGGYPAASDVSSIGRHRVVRLGTYGDPMAVPANVWQALVRNAVGHSGYTHQWANPAIPAAQRKAITSLCMASADTEREAAQARAGGLRYFRIRASTDAPLHAREFVCPASAEAGKRKTCFECQACDGTTRAGQASPVIVVHGTHATRFSSQVPA